VAAKAANPAELQVPSFTHWQFARVRGSRGRQASVLRKCGFTDVCATPFFSNSCATAIVSAARASNCGKRTVVGRRTVHLPQLHERRVRIRRERRDELTPKSELGETTD